MNSFCKVTFIVGPCFCTLLYTASNIAVCKREHIYVLLWHIDKQYLLVLGLFSACIFVS